MVDIRAHSAHILSFWSSIKTKSQIPGGNLPKSGGQGKMAVRLETRMALVGFLLFLLLYCSTNVSPYYLRVPNVDRAYIWILFSHIFRPVFFFPFILLY